MKLQNTVKNMKLLGISVILASGLTACGGGSSGTTNDDTTFLPLTANDFAKQVYVPTSIEPEEVEVITFFEGNTAKDYYYDENSSVPPEEDNLTWSITGDNKLSAGNNFGIDIFTLIRKDANVYTGKLEEPDGTVIENFTMNKALPLSLVDMEGKTFTLDTTDDPECSSIIVIISGSIATLKEQCITGNNTFMGILSDVAGLDNALQISFSDQERDNYTTMFVLFKGTINAGTFAFVDKINGVLDDVTTYKITSVNTLN